MEAQELLIALHDESAGYEISPDRVPLSVLRSFTRDVDEFLRGDGNDVDTNALDISIEKGSLAIRTAPTANPVLLNDLRKLANGQEMDGVGLKRRAVIERWQKSARGGRRWRVSIAADFLPAAIVISAESDFRADDADQWVRVERYVRGEIEDMGGHAKPNAHIRLPDGKALLVDAAREMLRDEKINRLYKPAMIRIVAEYNVMTREYRGAKLLEFVEHESRLDEKDLDRLTQRGAKAWRDVPDAGAWIDELRGSKE
ncbi:hypothetical protein [Variovorax sp.]|uniref:hypothetical protein n=1 Tax=Variovorax sp. TaxID=1871043 RepID=UPI003BAB8255